MQERTSDLKKLVRVYYEERGWNDCGIPKVETLQGLGLWDFMTAESKRRIEELVI
jgi:aldehyde:ferredoxin oxidoreductase